MSEVPGPGEGCQGGEGGGDQADGDVGQCHVTDVHVGRGPQLRAPDTGQSTVAQC